MCHANQRWCTSDIQRVFSVVRPRVLVPTRVTLGAVRVAEVPPRSTRALDPPRGAMGVLTARLPLRSLRLGVNAWREWREEGSSQGVSGRRHSLNIEKRRSFIFTQVLV